MKIKNKLLTLITPIICFGSVTPVIATLSSCGNTTKEDPIKYKTRTIKLSKVTSLDEINGESAPLCVLNTDSEHPYKYAIHVPKNSTVQLFMQTGILDNRKNEITWQDDWKQVTSSIEPTSFEYTRPIRFYALNTSNPGQFNTSLDANNCFYFSFIDDQSRTEESITNGIRIAGTVRSLLATVAPSKTEKTVEVLEDLQDASKYAFSNLFNGGVWSEMSPYPVITEVNPGFLPYKEMKEGCYANMFANCANLMSAPDLPSMTLAPKCYFAMFHMCQSLTSAPYLPAHNLEEDCYAEIFQGCVNMLSVSLGYVGNFITNPETGRSVYTDGWLGKTGARSTPTIYYDGEDINDETAIPTNFSIVSRKDTDPEWIEKYTRLIEIKDDSSISKPQTSLLTSTKTKFRAYLTDTVDQAVKQFPTSKAIPTESGIELHYYKKDGTNDPKILEVKEWEEAKASIENLPSVMYLKYEQPKEKEDLNVLNIVVSQPTKVTLNKLASSGHLEYYDNDSKAYKTWTVGKYFDLAANQALKIRGNVGSTKPGTWKKDGDPYLADDNANYTNIKITATNGTAGVVLDGSIMGILQDGEYQPLKELSNYCFTRLFEGSTGISSVSDTFLPTNLALKTGCYLGMFRDCTNLTKLPALPATELAELCYCEMFKGCTKITKVTNGMPETVTAANYLPATKSAKGCYNAMFSGCTALQIAPHVNFTGEDNDTLQQSVQNNYYIGTCARMFANCTALTDADFTLSAETLSPAAYSHMFGGDKKLTKAPKLLCKTLLSSNSTNEHEGSLAYMFENCGALVNGAKLSEDTTGWGDAGLYSMRGMYYMPSYSSYNKPALKRIPRFRFKSIGAYTCENMFNYCYNLPIQWSSSKPSDDKLIIDSNQWTLSSPNAKWMFCRTANHTRDTDTQNYTSSYYYYLTA